MRRLKIGIRTQLIVLVTFASLFSLLILAIVCGVYFSINLTDLRAERLEVISQLKSSQVTQAIEYLFYQVYYLTTRDAITNPLTSYRAGNNSMAVFDEAQSSLDQFLKSSESFASARLYNVDLKLVAESTNNNTLVSSPAADYLYPLQQNLSIPTEINQLTNNIDSYYFTGPVSNTSDPYSTYFMGVTYAIYGNTSIILSTPSIAGYLTVITSADNVQISVNSSQTSHGHDDTQDYKVIAYSPVFESNDTDDTASSSGQQLVGFQAVFPVEGSKYLQSNNVYNINESSSAEAALTHKFGSSTNKRNIDGEEVAVGFSRVDFASSAYWGIAIEQKKSTFNGPLDSLKNIIIGVSIGIGVFMCLITFPLAVLFIRPITKLKDATEAITRSKREKEKANLMSIDSPASGSPPPPPYYSTLIRRLNPYEKPTVPHKDKSEANSKLLGHKAVHRHDDDVEMEDISNVDDEGVSGKLRFRSRDKRSSVLSAGTGGSTSVTSTGIRLPSKITNLKGLFKDELAELTDAFNIMREELAKQYVHLEDRVKSRTKQLEASKIEAEAANEAKTVFIANISHELRTPLNGILGMTSIAMEENETSKIKDSLKLINRSGELLLHILTELLTYSKNTLNRSKLEKSSFQILEIVYQVQSIFNKLATDQRVYFKILVKPNSFRKLILYGDSNRIIQVVMNLVSNALKFTPVEGRVDVTFKLLGEYDETRSAANDYETVHVKHLNESDNHFDPDHEPDHLAPNSNDNGEKLLDADKTHPYDKRPPNKPYDDDTNESMHGLDSRNDDDSSETTSLYTLSTQEYDKVIFQSQFSNTKPLPQVPENTEASHKLINGANEEVKHKFILDKNGNVNATDNGLDISDNEPFDSSNDGLSSQEEKEMNDKVEELSRDNFPQLLPPPNMRSQDTYSSTNTKTNTNTNTIMSNNTNTTTTSTTKRPSVNSMDSLNSNELVKNGKVYKIKNLYKPKTWVLQIQVTDTGPGIEPALQEKVFEPFIQGDQTLSRSYGGTGLGLAICRQLAKMMKGSMTLKSTLGVGSTFVFTVPLPQVGEILVPEDDMVDFAEDEFNIKSRANRKVAFAVDKSDVSDDHMDSSNTTNVNTTNESPEFRHRVHGNGDIKNGHKRNNSESMDPILTSSPNGKLPTFNIKSDDDVSTTQHLRPSPPFMEKPHLVTRSSTGTANSANSTDKDNHGHNNNNNRSMDRLDLSSNDLLNSLSHLKILVAEDNMVNQEVIKRMLSLEGFNNITMASNGAEAVDSVKDSMERDELFDLIFMDIQMPKIDGLLATRMIRGNLNYNNPIIALTAFADESNVKECLNCGMSGFLSKPIRRTNLRKIITEYAPTLLNEVTTPGSRNSKSTEKRLGYN